jgi:hypothetical protein
LPRSRTWSLDHRVKLVGFYGGKQQLGELLNFFASGEIWAFGPREEERNTQYREWLKFALHWKYIFTMFLYRKRQPKRSTSLDAWKNIAAVEPKFGLVFGV